MKHMSGPMLAEADVVAVAVGLLPALREREIQTDKDRQVPAENIRLLAESGLLGIFRAKKWGGSELSIHLGWAAACGAIATAYIRATGAYLTGHHDFRGPMAKPHRMAAVTAVCLGMCFFNRLPLPTWGLGIILTGIAVTCVRRIHFLAKTLNRS